MKFTLVFLLGVFVLGANASKYSAVEMKLRSEPNELVSLPDGIKDLLEKALEVAKNIENKIIDLFEKFTENIQKIFDDVFGKIIDKIGPIIKKIYQLAKTAMATKMCVKQHQDELNAINEAVQADIKECASSTANEMMDLVQEVNVIGEKMKNDIEDVITKVKNCYNEETTIKVTLCVASKSFEIVSKAKSTYDLAKATIEDIQQRIPDILGRGQECIAVAQEKPTQRLNEILKEVQECVRELQFNERNLLN